MSPNVERVCVDVIRSLRLGGRSPHGAGVLIRRAEGTQTQGKSSMGHRGPKLEGRSSKPRGTRCLHPSQKPEEAGKCPLESLPK